MHIVSEPSVDWPPPNLAQDLVAAVAVSSMNVNAADMRFSHSPYQSTASVVVATLKSPNQPERKILCKLLGARNGADHNTACSTDELLVYEQVLSVVSQKTAGLVGSFSSKEYGDWILLEFMTGYAPLAKSGEQNALENAAEWIGSFHSQTSHMVSTAVEKELSTLNREYFESLCCRAQQFAEPLLAQYPWFPDLCSRFRSQIIEVLTSAEAAVIHGEYYPNNILIRNGTVIPVDWETSAISSGLIDLACLTERWPLEAVNSCIESYVQSRWIGNLPDCFDQEWLAVRIFMQLRWLGESPDWTLHESSAWRFTLLDHLRSELL